jgi:hypothetical protein
MALLQGLIVLPIRRQGVSDGQRDGRDAFFYLPEDSETHFEKNQHRVHDADYNFTVERISLIIIVDSQSVRDACWCLPICKMIL